MKIGDWIRRARLHKWHFVESVIDGDAITRCGRRMDRGTASGGGLEVSEGVELTAQLCRLCYRVDA